MRMRARVITLALAIAATAALSATAATPRPSTDPFQAGLCVRRLHAGTRRAAPRPGSQRRLQPNPGARASLAQSRHGEGPRRRTKLASSTLKPVVSTKPLSAKAKAQARHVLGQVRTCVRGFGFRLGAPRRSEPQPGPFLLRFQAERDCVAALAGVDEGGTHLRTACAAREEDFRDHRDRSRAGLADPVLADPLQADQMQDVGVRPAYAVIDVRSSLTICWARRLRRSSAARTPSASSMRSAATIPTSRATSIGDGSSRRRAERRVWWGPEDGRPAGAGLPRSCQSDLRPKRFGFRSYAPQSAVLNSRPRACWARLLPTWSSNVIEFTRMTNCRLPSSLLKASVR